MYIFQDLIEVRDMAHRSAPLKVALRLVAILQDRIDCIQFAIYLVNIALEFLLPD